MKILITGVACVGSTTIGRHLAEALKLPFYDLAREVEAYYGKPIEAIQADCGGWMDRYRERITEVLEHLVRKREKDLVISMTPSSMMGPVWRVVKRVPDAITVVLRDRAVNILERITFYDENSQLIEVPLTPKMKKRYLKEIREDMDYYGDSYRRADLKVRIAGLGMEKSVAKLQEELERHPKYRLLHPSPMDQV